MIADAAHYHDGVRIPGAFMLPGALEKCVDGTFCWIGLFEPTDLEFQTVRTEFDLHELAVEDAVSAHQRPKLERYDDTLFLVIKPAIYSDREELITLGEILLFIDERFVVAVRHGEAGRLVEVRKDLEAAPEQLIMGPGAVLLAIVDRVVDDYAKVLSEFEEDIQEVEVQVFSEGAHNPTRRIYRLIREILEFQHATSSLIDPLDRLTHGRYRAVSPDLREYFRNTHDHLTRVVRRVETLIDLLTTVLEANLTQVTVRQNGDMRKISAWVAIAAVPTMLAGVWGMNFQHMPELAAAWGYPLAIGLMAVSCLTLYRMFKKSGWL